MLYTWKVLLINPVASIPHLPRVPDTSSSICQSAIGFDALPLQRNAETRRHHILGSWRGRVVGHNKAIIAWRWACQYSWIMRLLREWMHQEREGALHIRLNRKWRSNWEEMKEVRRPVRSVTNLGFLLPLCKWQRVWLEAIH